MPKIVKLSRRLGRLTLKEERDYGKYTAQMQLEFSTFDHATDPLTRFGELSNEINVVADDLACQTLTDENLLGNAIVRIELLRNNLTSKLKMLNRYKRKVEEMNKWSRVQAMAAPIPPNQPSAILPRAQSMPHIATTAASTPTVSAPAATANSASPASLDSATSLLAIPVSPANIQTS